MENSPVSGLRMWRRIFNLDCYRRSLRSSRFLSFPGRDRTRERKSGRTKKHAWREQNIGEKWRGGEREGGEGGRRKGIACSQSQTFYRTPFAHEREAIVQFDWLLARQSKYVIRNSAFEGVFEVSVHETSKDLFQYGNLIVLKQEQEAAIGD